MDIRLVDYDDPDAAKLMDEVQQEYVIRYGEPDGVPLDAAQFARGKGFARGVLAELEHSAWAAGRSRVILETGTAQPEALALYRSSGFHEIAPYGYYKTDPRSICFAKDLVP